MLLNSKTAVGLELEYEGVSPGHSSEFLYVAGLDKQWAAKEDGSLRPRNQSTEFVFRGPMVGELALEAINGLSPILQEHKYKVSWRCGMHVHLDHRKEPPLTKVHEVVLACMIDRLWFGWDNSGRHESKFCVPMASVWKSMLQDGKGSGGRSKKLKGYKYTGVNISRSGSEDIGTVEYRYAECTKDSARMIEFISMSLACMELARRFDNTGDLLSTFSTAGTYENWIADCMPTELHGAWASGLPYVIGEHSPNLLEREAALMLSQTYGVL